MIATAAGLVALGLLTGSLVGLVGVGGGVLYVPLLLAVGLSQLDAQATSLLAIVPGAVTATAVHARRGNVAWGPVTAIALGSLAGIAAGAATATSVPEAVLRRLFALLLVVAAARLLLGRRRLVDDLEPDCQ
jgi:uncharacterized protein